MFDDLSLNARGRLPTWPGDGLGRAIHPYEESSGARGKPQIISEGHFPAVSACDSTAPPTMSTVQLLAAVPLLETLSYAGLGLGNA